jgi:hypothetical protein
MVPQAKQVDNANADSSNVPRSGKKKMTITVSLSFGLRDRPGVLSLRKTRKTTALKAETEIRFLAGVALLGWSSSRA